MSDEDWPDWSFYLWNMEREKMNGWVSVKDGLPEEDVEVLIDTDAGIYIGTWTQAFRKTPSGLYEAFKEPRVRGNLLLCDECHHWEEGVTITHWREIPKRQVI